MLELLWTGFTSLCRRDYRLKSETSLWMLPIYGLAGLCGPFFAVMSGFSLLARLIVYPIAIFAAEYVSGRTLTRIAGRCPWDYSGCRTSVRGVIRLDYWPLWFIVGLLYQRLLCGKPNKKILT